LDVRPSAVEIFRLQPDLVEFIRAEISNNGPQSFAWFMERALYHPELGYYSSGQATIGRRGDYFTNVSVGPLFGQLLAGQFIEIWERLGKIDNFKIVEQGAHDGQFARDVLEFAQQSSPEFYEIVGYEIVEPFSILQDRQSQTLREFGDRVQWRKSLEETEPFVGIHFSNELFDSMPVHLILSTTDGWRERFVGLDRNEFVFIDRAILNAALREFVETLPARPAGYQTEVNLAALDWVDILAKKLQSGCVLAIDYGFSRDEFYSPDRATGTLQTRAQHRQLHSPFREIGRADITAHVEWTSLAQCAEQCGLQLIGFTDQHHFITGLISDARPLPQDSKSKRALQTLLHPEMLGRAFQVLALSKDVDLKSKLSGFKFARDARLALGL
jgi:SAM-dependent MidA family methyltransferase